MNQFSTYFIKFIIKSTKLNKLFKTVVITYLEVRIKVKLKKYTIIYNYDQYKRNSNL